MKILAWAFSIVLGLFSVAAITENAVSGVLLFLGAALICPPLWEFIREKSGFEYRKSAATTLLLGGVIAGTIAHSNTPEGRAAAAERAAEQKKNDETDDAKSPKLAAAEGVAVIKEEIGRVNFTAPQRNAVRSAEQYLSISGFSRDGLIQQLSSDAGDGYSVPDATAAVDSLSVDWNENAVKSAKQYLSISGFSCNGLIQQLSSSAGDKYTVEQATYGARQAGAC